MTKFYSLCMALCFVVPVYAKVIYVNQNASGQNNGSSWADAFTNPNIALPTAQYGDEIWVAKGAYFPYPAAPILSFVLVSGTKLFGGFNGTESSIGQRDWAANETILYGDEPGFTWLNVVYGENTDSSTLLDGFTIRGGHADITIFGLPCSEPNGVDCAGGGIYLYNDNPNAPTMLTIRNCRFICNGALQGGGIAANFAKGSGGLIVEKCYFKDNGCNDVGGGIFIETNQHPQHKIRVDSCLFEYNYGYTSSCISVHNTNNQLDLKITNSVFQFNKAYYSCAGIYIGNGSYAKPVVKSCTFYRNEAGWINQTIPGTGGALFGSNYDVVSCSFRENKANSGGAIGMGNGSIINCLFEDNWAKTEGGALWLTNKNNLINCTFFKNQAGKKGGAIFNVSHSRDTIINCIFIENKAGELGDWMVSNTGKNYIDYTMIDVENCDSLKEGLHPMYDTRTCGPNMFFNIDPLFRDTAMGDYRLKGCSPLLNEGDSTWVSRLGFLTDLDGHSRWQDGIPDIGAYETTKSDSLKLVATVTPTNSIQNPNGSIVLTTVTGGTIPYTYEWSTGGTEDTIGNLDSGTYTVSVADLEGCSNIWEFEVLLISGTEQQDGSTNLRIYPNPATDWVHFILPVTNSKRQLNVADASGKIIISQALPVHESVCNLNIMDLESGEYTLIITANAQIGHIGKIIVR
ncbi:MAG: T9SS type A sorting domain-containing protein [Saprospiraceae bacterium]